MFLGEYSHQLDSKGRLILPAAFRAELSEGLVMTVGLDRCLTVYSRAEWQRVAEGLRALRSTDRRERAFARVLRSSAQPEELDKQGRITIPARLREYADLSTGVTVVGADGCIELWDTESWTAYRQSAMADFADTEESFGLGIF